ncbi:DEAD/DEAH box helicase, partial [Sansalvadorimonas verongulae]|uniref:DEAD/DEAH box helicase n=1 Tax=Sansalvadorimonas verongulae TaxID=2172824 RepID=UPI0012BBB50F
GNQTLGICCQRTEKEAFKATARARQFSYEYRFESQEYKDVHEKFFLLGGSEELERHTQVKLVKEFSDLGSGVIVIQAAEEPPAFVSLVPDEFVPASVIEKAIERTVREFDCGGLVEGASAILDFLQRSRPRINGLSPGTAIVDTGRIADKQDQITQAIRNLDSSCLPIQGPPGAGKTYTATRAIAELLKTGKKIGIVSNSHKAINHLLISTAKYCQQQSVAAKFCCTKETEPTLKELGVSITKNAQLSDYVSPGCVIGTTAWGFSRTDMESQLDYLFVDEAGQVSVANFIAVARSARNLVIMGDQMQLGQPSQASHPGDSGLSILDYLMRDTPTIPADMGVFLDITWRMHPAVNRFISEQIYEGKLESHPDNAGRVIDVPEGEDGILQKDAGIIYVPVEHEGNTQGSDEEVAVIRELAQSLIGRVFHFNKSDSGRKIGWDDILFVAPYNLQVNKLKMALGKQARVGSVDKFQGQEAPVVFLSMCASDASETLRGLDFLFDRHRINVAISRAQSMAIVVGNPELGRVSVNRVEQLRLVNLFDAVLSEAYERNSAI